MFKNSSRNFKKNISKRPGKFLKNMGVFTDYLALTVSIAFVRFSPSFKIVGAFTF
ncbi:hypothetical protein LEP1GSC137_2292 [Leptospira borgpetersenii str. Noumea 25]|uniref:Uncharacterized protein n=6 Tax=Leptospira borgpetersenii TaxID=174 RepID=M3HW24_LEPBO|nr:hypothetical protein LBBP_02959 [Leptospira borgpetersenii serovar Ballum]EKP15658.1 hypothetical protein LEP1GSC128_0048 [Leptospira borgpetersenii str. 200801926]EKR00704.1 hypothetical protein LEP1GSC121_0678 [Leptospira borgpetersenii serovar Castellonis str. 200801910]EMG02261.1 hypothetical protein LEP1GSC123_0867 [Leptospira borgpetersenii str. 200701203]EMK08972.1 hypothetical protein LEP1GSC066_1114 [Leptospira sp. serovar Kenya str. Sh9]EMN13307.1 hypothetical protein LEP1GSC055_1